MIKGALLNSPNKRVTSDCIQRFPLTSETIPMKSYKTTNHQPKPQRDARPTQPIQGTQLKTQQDSTYKRTSTLEIIGKETTDKFRRKFNANSTSKLQKTRMKHGKKQSRQYAEDPTARHNIPLTEMLQDVFQMPYSPMDPVLQSIEEEPLDVPSCVSRQRPYRQRRGRKWSRFDSRNQRHWLVL